jgi:DNA-binding response OmpR family regulator
VKPAAQRILVVEDDANIALGLREVLSGEGFEVLPCARGDLAVELCTRHNPDLVLLDVMLPGLSGYDVCRQLRGRGCHTPILMLTAKGQELDKVVGLQIGADDYVTKPFYPEELVARIHARLRGTRAVASTGTTRVGPIEIDLAAREVRVDGALVELTPVEHTILAHLAARAGRAVTRADLAEAALALWGLYRETGDASRLRQVGPPASAAGHACACRPRRTLRPLISI